MTAVLPRVDMDKFLKEIEAYLTSKESLVKIFRANEIKKFEYGDQLDCFSCMLNQRFSCELICTSEFIVNEQPDIFANVSTNLPCYVLEIDDHNGELYLLRDIETTPVVDTITICFSGFDNSLHVLRELVSLYDAAGV